MAGIQEVYDLVVKGKAKKVAAAVTEALDAGCDPTEILNKGMIAAMDEVGAKFKNGEIFVPEMLVAAKAMKNGVEVLKPHLASGVAGAAGKVIIGTVSGDLHDIGKNLVAMMLESSGFEVIDLGVDVPKEKFVEAYEANPDTKLICCSALSDDDHERDERDGGASERVSVPRKYQGDGRRSAHQPGICR